MKWGVDGWSKKGSVNFLREDFSILNEGGKIFKFIIYIGHHY